MGSALLIGRDGRLHHREHRARAADANRLGCCQGVRWQHDQDRGKPGKAQERAHDGHNDNRTLGDARRVGG